jgi:YVTN family beta-propeller protein
MQGWLGRPGQRVRAAAPHEKGRKGYGHPSKPWARTGARRHWLAASESVASRSCAGGGGPPGRLYVANSGSDDVTVIDTANNQVVDTVQVGRSPNGVAVSRKKDNLEVYVTNFDANTVSIIDSQTLEATDTVTVGRGPTAVRTDRDSTLLFVTNFNGDTLSVVDIAAEPKVWQTLKVGRAPSGIGENYDGNLLYVANNGSNNATILICNNYTDSKVPCDENPTATWEVGSRPHSVAYNWKNARVYVTNAGENTVSVLTGSILRPITVGKSPTGIAVDQEGTKAGTRAYVANFGSNTISVIDIPANQPENRVREKEIGTVAVGRGPTGVAVSQDGTRVYVTNFTDDTVSVIDAATNQVVATVMVGRAPSGIAVDPPPGQRG